LKFRFEAILKLRKNKENAAQKVLASINSHLLKQQDQLSFMENIEMKSEADLNARMSQGASIPMMMLYDDFFKGVRSQEKSQARIIKEISSQLEVRRSELAQATARRRIMEFLKERDIKAHETKLRKREIEQMDEIGATQWRLKYS
jgi:flagellar FliJ protein